MNIKKKKKIIIQIESPQFDIGDISGLVPKIDDVISKQLKQVLKQLNIDNGLYTIKTTTEIRDV